MNDPLPKHRRTDVIIIGAGPLGWSCAQILSRNKVKTTLVDKKSSPSPSFWMSNGLGVFWPSLNDPPTRAVVAHGRDMAQWLQDFCTQGLSVVQDILGRDHLIAIPSFRIGLENHETLELKLACETDLGLRHRIEIGEDYFCEKNDSLIIKNKISLCDQFGKNKYISIKKASAKSILDSIHGCEVIFDDGTSLQSEMVIVATGYRIATLENWLSPMLIPMSDVISHWMTNFPADQNANSFSIRTSSGHVAAIFSPQMIGKNECVWSLKMTGPRFTLPGAGVGIDLSGQAIDPTLPQKIELWIREKLIPKILPLMNAHHSQSSQSRAFSLYLQSMEYGVDCLPCDELPVLGELGNQGRILGSTGWLGCGWSASFQAGLILSELILSGSSSKLKPLLRPKRWRSGLNESTGSGVTGMT